MRAPSRNRARVLIVDDLRAMRKLIRLSLEESGRFEVVGEAAEGRDAVAAALRTRPDLILLDLSMPGMNGLEALPRLREVCPQARIVIHTGFEQEHLARQALGRGAHGYIEKGLPPAAFVTRLSDAAQPALTLPIAAESHVAKN